MGLSAESRKQLMRRCQTRDGPHPVDVYVGGRMKQLRILRGMTQERLAARLDLTFQQIQKYEKGANRMAASRLYDVARILGVPVSYFFEDLPESFERLPVQDDRRRARKAVESYQGSGAGLSFDHRRETLELVRAYYEITEPGLRKKLLALAKGLSAASADTPADLPPPSMLIKPS